MNTQTIILLATLILASAFLVWCIIGLIKNLTALKRLRNLRRSDLSQ